MIRRIAGAFPWSLSFFCSVGRQQLFSFYKITSVDIFKILILHGKKNRLLLALTVAMVIPSFPQSAQRACEWSVYSYSYTAYLSKSMS